MTNETLKLIASRRSHRAYESTPLTEEQLSALLDAAVASPSAVNRQPWHFVVVRDAALIDAMDAEVHNTVMKREESARSPRFLDPAFHVFYHAPCVIFILGKKNSIWTQLDCGIAVENIALAAESIGLGSVILGMPRDAFAGDRKQEFLSALNAAEDEEFAIAIAVGTPTDTKPAHPVGENKITIL